MKIEKKIKNKSKTVAKNYTKNSYVKWKEGYETFAKTKEDPMKSNWNPDNVLRNSFAVFEPAGPFWFGITNLNFILYKEWTK